MADPQKPAEMRPPIAPGADSQAPTNVNRPPPSSDNIDVNKIEKKIEKIVSSFEDMAEELEKNTKVLKEQRDQAKKAIEAQIKTTNLAAQGKATLEELNASAEEAKKAKAIVAELEKEEAGLTATRTDNTKKTINALRLLAKNISAINDTAEGIAGFGGELEGAKEKIEELKKAASELSGGLKKGEAVDIEDAVKKLKDATEFLGGGKGELKTREDISESIKTMVAKGFGLNVEKALTKQYALYEESHDLAVDLFKLDSTTSEKAQQNFEKMMSSDEGREEMRVKLSEKLAARDEKLTEQILKLQKERGKDSKQQLAILKSQRDEVRKNHGELKKADEASFAVVNQLLGNVVKMNDEQRDRHREQMEAQLEKDESKGGLLDSMLRGLFGDELTKAIKDGFRDAREEKSSVKKFLIYAALIGGAITAGLWARLVTWFSTIRYIAVGVGKLFGAGERVAGVFGSVVQLLRNIAVPFAKFFNWMLGSSGFIGTLARSFRIGFKAIGSIPFIGWIINGIIALIDIFRVFRNLAGSTDSFFTKLMKGIVVALINFLTLGFLDFKKVLNFVNKLFSDFPGAMKDLFIGIGKTILWWFNNVTLRLLKWTMVDLPLFLLKLTLYTVKFFTYDLPKFLVEATYKILKFFFYVLPKFLYYDLPIMVYDGIKWLVNWTLKKLPSILINGIRRLFSYIMNKLADMPIIGRFFKPSGAGRAAGEGLVEKIVGYITVFFKKLGMIIDYLKSIFSGVGDFVGGVVTKVKGWFGKLLDDVNRMMLKVKVYFDIILNAVYGFFDKIKMWVVNTFSSFENFGNFIKNLPKTILTAIMDSFKTFLTLGPSLGNRLLKFIFSDLSKIAFKDMWGKVSNGITDLVNKMPIAKKIVEILDKIKESISGPLGRIKSVLTKFADIFEKIGNRVSEGIVKTFNKFASSSIGKFLGMEEITEEGGAQGGGTPASVTPAPSTPALTPEKQAQGDGTPKPAVVSGGLFNQGVQGSEKMSLSDYTQAKAEDEVSSSDYGSVYTFLKNLLDTGDALLLDDNALAKAVLDASDAYRKGKINPNMEPKLRALKDSYWKIVEDRKQAKGVTDKVQKSPTKNVVGEVGAGLTKAKEEKATRDAATASKAIVSTNSVVQQRSTNTTSVTSAPSRFNAEPTLRGTQMGALPGLI